jgi:hypothetical protein
MEANSHMNTDGIENALRCTCCVLKAFAIVWFRNAFTIYNFISDILRTVDLVDQMLSAVVCHVLRDSAHVLY